MKVRCSKCKKVLSGRIPKGGDGSLHLPYKHKWSGKICDGSYEEAELLETTNNK